ncbi:hypothetical protein AB0N31_29115 [Streptomyces sp. NPDC051051]|uniref:hypothetical protein n=1 Tax=Streptomyces sp. NPDC051051 TaxID=3155666 RepID=UPI0034437021
MTGKHAFARMCLVAAVVTAAATGCTGDGDSGDDGGPGGRAGAAPPTWQQELRVTDALQRLTKRCMNRHGFTYWEDRTLTLRESRPVRYVQDDVAWARTYGYGGPVEAKNERTRLHHPNAAYRQRLSAGRRAAFDRALDGGDDARTLSVRLPGTGTEVGKRVGGCSAEAEEALYGDPATWFRAARTATGLRALYGEDLMRDRELTAAVRAWSRCMRGAGLAHADPQAARDAIRANTARLGPARADEAFALERRTAVADARCAREADLRSVVAAREAHYVDRLRDRYGDALDTYERLQRQAYDRAVRIVPPRA